jgi:hypothetical protein
MLESVAVSLTQNLGTWDEVAALAATLPDDESRAAVLNRGIASLSPAEAAAHLDAVTGSRYWPLRRAITGDPPLPLDQALALVPEFAAEDKTGYNDLKIVRERLLEQRGPEATLAWAASLPETHRQSAMEDIYYQWAGTDPAAAAAAAFATGDREQRGKAIETTLEAWVDDDPAAASEWLSQQPPGAARDAGAARIAQSVFSTDPVRALAWAASIQDAKARSAALGSFPAYESEFQISGTFRAAVQASTLTDAEKAQILKTK